MEFSSKGNCSVRLPILTYHRVLPRTDINQITSREECIYTLEDSLFEQQMIFLEDNGYSTVSFYEIGKHLNSPYSLPLKPVILTFDDGLKDNYYITFQILKKYNFKATIFIVTSFVGKEGYLNWQQICEMSDMGMEIQSHTHTHRNLNELSDEEIQRELALSKDIVEGKVNKNVDILALPFGRGAKMSIKQIALNLGYLFICTSICGGNNINKRSFYLKRLSIKHNSDMLQFKSFIELRKLALFLYKTKRLPMNLLRAILSKKIYDMIRKKILDKL